MALIYNEQVRFNWNLLWLAMLVFTTLAVAGCSGVNASGTVSPASFFLPGMLKADPQAVPNTPVAGSMTFPQLAQAR